MGFEICVFVFFERHSYLTINPLFGERQSELVDRKIRVDLHHLIQIEYGK